MAEPTDEQLREAERQLEVEGHTISNVRWIFWWTTLIRERALRIAERAEHAAAIAELVAALEDARAFISDELMLAQIDEVISKK